MLKMKNPEELDRRELVEIARHLQGGLFVDDDGKITLDKDVNGGDLVEEMTSVLHHYGLAPQESGKAVPV